METYQGHIGVMDSGVGGISVLRSLVRILPEERFYFFGDSANTPYGDRTANEVLDLTREIVEDMIAKECKAVVIACNTATSAAAATLRAEHPELPIIGIEPALKPAAAALDGRPILVMATAATLALEKFHDLALHWGSNAQIFTVACAGLADLVETGDLDGEPLARYLEEKLGPYRGKVDAVVLGCTHYPFIKKQIALALGSVAFFDGSDGTAHQLARKLDEYGLRAPAGQTGGVEFRSSNPGPAQTALYERFLSLPL